jgi:hypothetical protein
MFGNSTEFLHNLQIEAIWGIVYKYGNLFCMHVCKLVNRRVSNYIAIVGVLMTHRKWNKLKNIP